MKQKIILIGGGGHCKSCIEVIESTSRYEIFGIIDIPQLVGTKVLGYDIIGTDNDIPNYVAPDIQFLITVGQIKSAELKIKLHQKVLDAGGNFVSIIASTAHVSKFAKIGTDTIIMHYAMINADSFIGNGCIINTFANIEHDSVISDFCHISTGAMVNGNCSVGRGTFLGSQSVMVNGVSIIDGCVIAAGAMVRKNIFIKGLYSGNPALMKIKYE